MGEALIATFLVDQPERTPVWAFLDSANMVRIELRAPGVYEVWLGRGAMTGERARGSLEKILDRLTPTWRAEMTLTVV